MDNFKGRLVEEQSLGTNGSHTCYWLGDGTVEVPIQMLMELANEKHVNGKGLAVADAAHRKGIWFDVRDGEPHPYCVSEDDSHVVVCSSSTSTPWAIFVREVKERPV